MLCSFFFTAIKKKNLFLFRDDQSRPKRSDSYLIFLELQYTGTETAVKLVSRQHVVTDCVTHWKHQMHYIFRLKIDNPLFRTSIRRQRTFTLK